MPAWISLWVLHAYTIIIQDNTCQFSRKINASSSLFSLSFPSLPSSTRRSSKSKIISPKLSVSLSLHALLRIFNYLVRVTSRSERSGLTLRSMVLVTFSKLVGFFAVVASASSPINSNSEPSSTCFILEPTVQTASNGGVPMTWLPSCWDGFNVQVAPTPDQHLMVNSACNFNVSVQVRQPGRYSANSSALSTSFPGVISPPHNQVFVRLVLCPEPNSGECSPFSDAVNVTTDMWTSSSEVTVGNNGQISSFQVPAQNNDPDFYFTTPFQKVILTPGVTVNVNANGTADIYSTSTNELIVGPDYINQAGDLIFALNFTSESNDESRIFQLFGKKDGMHIYFFAAFNNGICIHSYFVCNLITVSHSNFQRKF